MRFRRAGSRSCRTPSRTSSRPTGRKAEGDYVLAVGTLEPRKNLERIARAVDGELRVVGARGWGGVEAPANVTWLPDASDEELAALYRGARCLVYASLYEGFGIPVAEALACGCPIVTTAGSPMAELAGGDAVLVDPTDVAAISGRDRPRDRADAAARRELGRRRRAHARGLRGGGRVILVDADVLGRGRTGEETYIANLLRELPAAAPDLQFAAVTRHPELVPGRRRGDRAARALPGGADGRVAAAPPSAARAAARALPACAAARLRRAAASSRCTTSTSSATRA